MNTIQDWLSSATGWRWASLLFQSPTSSTKEELQELADELPEEFSQRAKELSAIALDEWETEFHRVLGPAGCPACESSYEENVLAGRGPLLAEIAGFYQAFAYRPESATRETPDHLTTELSFLSYLALKVAYAMHEERAQEQQIAEAAYWRFLQVHPLFWLERFCERVGQTDSPFYRAGVDWLAKWTQRQMQLAPAQA